MFILTQLNLKEIRRKINVVDFNDDKNTIILFAISEYVSFIFNKGKVLQIDKIQNNYKLLNLL